MTDEFLKNGEVDDTKVMYALKCRVDNVIEDIEKLSEKEKKEAIQLFLDYQAIGIKIFYQKAQQKFDAFKIKKGNKHERMVKPG